MILENIKGVIYEYNLKHMVAFGSIRNWLLDIQVVWQNLSDAHFKYMRYIWNLNQMSLCTEINFALPLTFLYHNTLKLFILLKIAAIRCTFHYYRFYSW